MLMAQGAPEIRRVIVVVPSSLVRNWEAEFKKWLGDERLKPLVRALGDRSYIALTEEPPPDPGLYRPTPNSVGCCLANTPRPFMPETMLCS